MDDALVRQSARGRPPGSEPVADRAHVAKEPSNGCWQLGSFHRYLRCDKQLGPCRIAVKGARADAASLRHAAPAAFSWSFRESVAATGTTEFFEWRLGRWREASITAWPMARTFFVGGVFRVALAGLVFRRVLIFGRSRFG